MQNPGALEVQKQIFNIRPTVYVEANVDRDVTSQQLVSSSTTLYLSYVMVWKAHNVGCEVL